MGPDPEKIHKSNFDQADYVINPMQDEMEVDNEENNHNGYVILNQENDQNFMALDDDDSDYSDDENEQQNTTADPEQETAVISNLPTVPPIRRSSEELAAAVWNNSTSSANIEITNEKSQQITQIMSNIKLPNAPAWLNEINTENILERIKNKGSESTVNKN